MSYERLRQRLPDFLQRYLWYFETDIEDAVARFAATVPPHARVLDAGAGEGRYSHYFRHVRFTGVDLAIGDVEWDYTALDVLADLTALPFPTDCFEASLNIVTLEHVREPSCVLGELARTLAPGGRLLLVVPQDYEVHQAPHDYYRYTRYGIRYLLEKAGFIDVVAQPSGGLFRLIGRRLLNSLGLFPGFWVFPAALFLAPPALLLPLMDGLDRQRNFTLGYICTARKR